MSLANVSGSSRDRGGVIALSVEVVDAAGNQIVAFGSGVVTNAGVFAVQEDGPALTALQLLDDIVVTIGTSLYAESVSKGALVGVVRADTIATLVDTAGEIAPLQVDERGRLYTRVSAPSSSVAAVVASATNVTLLAANTARLGASLYNDSNKSVRVKLGAVATLIDFTVEIVKGGYYEVPMGYTGIIDGIWVSAPSGDARVTELT